MRTLAIFGAIAIFVAVAVTPPTMALASFTLPTQIVTATRDSALRAVGAISPTVRRSADWKALLSRERDLALRKAYESIDWAQRKASVSLCKKFDASVSLPSGVGVPTAGDLLALCLAKVTADASRCSQIDPTTAPVLRALCQSELVRPT